MSDSVRSGRAWRPHDRPAGPSDTPIEGDEIVVEELTLVPPARLASGSAGRVLPLAAVVALVATVGLGGRILDGDQAGAPAASPSPVAATPSSPAPLFVLLEPGEGARLAGSAVTVRGTARAALGSVRVAVVVGSVVLGQADIAVRAAGPVTATVPILTGLAPLSASLEVTRTQGGSAVMLARRGLVVTATSPVQVWRAVYVPGRPRANIEIDGFAPLTVPTISASAADGDLREASTTTRVWPLNGRNSQAAAAIGLAVFRVEVSLMSDTIPSTVTISWRDVLDGTSGSIVTAVQLPPDTRPTATAAPASTSSPLPRSSP